VGVCLSSVGRICCSSASVLPVRQPSVGIDAGPTSSGSGLLCTAWLARSDAKLIPDAGALMLHNWQRTACVKKPRWNCDDGCKAAVKSHKTFNAVLETRIRSHHIGLVRAL
jgi:hypothetical protein